VVESIADRKGPDTIHNRPPPAPEFTVTPRTALKTVQIRSILMPVVLFRQSIACGAST